MLKSLLIVGLVGITGLLVFRMQSVAASPFSAQTAPCANCHVAHTQVRVFANPTTRENGTSTYMYTIVGPYPGAFGLGVFKDGTKVSESWGPIGSITLSDDAVYTLYAVNKDPNSMAGFAVTSVNTARSP